MSHFQLTLLRITPNPAGERVHVAALHLYEAPNRQNQSMVIKIGNINQPFRSRAGMTGKEHKRTSGVKKGFSILTVCWLHSVLSNVFIETLQTVHLRSVHSNICKLILNF